MDCCCGSPLPLPLAPLGMVEVRAAVKADVRAALVLSGVGISAARDGSTSSTVAGCRMAACGSMLPFTGLLAGLRLFGWCLVGWAGIDLEEACLGRGLELGLEFAGVVTDREAVCAG